MARRLCLVAGLLLAGCQTYSAPAEDGVMQDSRFKPVSYTHLDVYKRQALDGITQSMAPRQSATDSQKESLHMPTIETSTRSSLQPAVLDPSWINQRLSEASDRREVQELLEKLVDKADPAQRKAQGLSDVQRRLLPAWERALVFTDGHNTRFVLLAMTDKQPRLLLWQLVLRPASLRLLYKLPKQKQLQQEQARLPVSYTHLDVYKRQVLDGEYYLVMEYVRGGDLQLLLRRARRRGQRFSAAAALYICLLYTSRCV